MRLRDVLPATLAAGLSACVPFAHRTPAEPPPPAEANLTPRYYEVAGLSVGQLTASLTQHAPESTDTGVYFARTTWTLSWDGRWTMRDGACHVISSVATLETQMALPRWVAAPGAPADLAADWSNFVRSLRRHEAGHVLNAVAAARAVETSLKELRADSCATMETDARVKIDSVVAAFRARDEIYDETTRHGAAQGAVWPPRSNVNVRSPGPDAAIKEIARPITP